MVKTIGNVQKDAQVRAVASGTLSNGDTVIVNSDGTVSAITETSTSEDLGSPTTILSGGGGGSYIASGFDSASNKVVVAFYGSAAYSEYGTAVVGTVSGTSISFGTPVVFESAEVDGISLAFDTTNSKMVISYRDRGNSFRGTSVVGTVSGTSISFGTPVTFAGTNQAGGTSSVYDSASGNIAIFYNNQSSSYAGTAVVGTVSGTSISFGTPVVFDSGSTEYIAAALDTSSNKIHVAYRDGNNSNRGTGIVATVSGTSISFGSSTVFETGAAMYISSDFDSNAGKVLVVYRDAGNSGYGTVVLGTISGTSVTFTTPVVFASQDTQYTSCAFDSNAGKFVIGYEEVSTSYAKLIDATVDGSTVSFGTAQTIDTNATTYTTSVFDSGSNKVVISYKATDAKSVVFQNASTATNLTSDNFIGFADGAYADTQSAVINTTCSVDRNQTSLTAGQKYYVQTNGALGLTAADPSVEAGTAISSTEILVKG